MKDHEVAQLYNRLRDAALKYKDVGQLRSRLSSIVWPLVRDLIQSKVLTDNLDKEVKRQDKKIIDLEQYVESLGGSL